MFQCRRFLAIPAMAVLTLCTGCAVPRGRTGPRPRISIPPQPAPGVEQFGVLELAFDLEAAYVCPFDTREIRVTADVLTPSGAELCIPCFQWQPFRVKLAERGPHKGFEPAGPTQWRFRFRPTEVGTYRYRLRAVDLCGLAATAWHQFECRPAAERAAETGFIRVVPDRRYFQFDSGEPYFAIGHNVCWPGRHRGILDYDHYFAKMAANGENYTRVWMCLWAFGVQWGTTARDLRLDWAWALDYVFDLADKHGIKIMLCLDCHGALREKKGNLGKNPYLGWNGGPCAEPREFFTNARARQLYRDRLRYLVARYSHRTSLLAWEFWNEVDLVDGYDERRVAKWHREMAEYLRKTDPYGHLITTSCASPRRGQRMWRLKQIDYTQTHSYNLDDKAADVLRWSRDKAQYRKPHFVGEFGFSGGLHGRGQDDEEGLHLHNGLWASALSGDAGTAMLWWWDHYIDPKGLYCHFKALSRFLHGVPWIEGEFQPATVEVAYAEGAMAEQIDVSLEPTAASWKRAPFNRPSRFTVSRFGEVESKAALSKVLHGLGNHPKLRNPATFEIDCQHAGRFVAQVLGVSGHGGANLHVSVDGKEELFADFLDPDGKTGTETLRQYDGDYAVDLTSGVHEVVVENTGQDWLYVAYRLEGLCVSRQPNLRAVCLRGRDLVLLWIHNRASTWAAVMEGRDPREVRGAVVRVPDLAPGAYEMEWWDTYRGIVSGRDRVGLVGEREEMHLVLPAIRADVACKIRPAK